MHNRSSKTREQVLRDFRTDQILEAARRVIGEVGFAEASIDRIAEAAGVARSTLYVYFDGKEDLLNQCIAQLRLGLGERVRQAVEEASGTEERLAAFLGSPLRVRRDGARLLPRGDGGARRRPVLLAPRQRHAARARDDPRGERSGGGDDPEGRGRLGRDPGARTCPPRSSCSRS